MKVGLSFQRDKRSSDAAMARRGQPSITAVTDRRQRHLHDPCSPAEVRRSPALQAARLQATSVSIEPNRSPSSVEPGVVGVGLFAFGSTSLWDRNLSTHPV